MIKDQNPLKLEGIHGGYAESGTVVFGIPFDGTVSHKKGAKLGPQAIRLEMDALETYSPYQNKDLLDYRICDLGDLPLPSGNTKKVLDTVKTEVEAMLADGKKTVALGGEHLISYPVIQAYAKRYPDIFVLHFDAHADLRQDYSGEELSHATVMRRVYETLPSGKLWQFGIRSGTKEEFDFAKAHTRMCLYDLNGIEKAVETIGKAPVYVSIDLDVLDPSVFPGTGTPEPGGISFKELLEGLIKLSGLNILGGDIVELAPDWDPSGVSGAGRVQGTAGTAAAYGINNGR